MIYRTATNCIVRSPEFFVVMSLLIFVGGVAVEYFEVSSSALFVAWVIIAYHFHRGLMFGELDWARKPQDLARPAGMGWFAFIFAGSFLLTVGLVIWSALAIAKNTPLGSADGTTVGLVLVMYCVASLVLLPVFGTAFPAAAAADRFGLTITLQRARTTWFKIFKDLIVGPGLYWAAYLGGLIWFQSNVLEIDRYHTTAGGWQFEQLMLGVVLSFLQVFPVLLTATVLCLAYKEVASTDVQEVMLPELRTS